MDFLNELQLKPEATYIILNIKALFGIRIFASFSGRNMKRENEV